MIKGSAAGYQIGAPSNWISTVSSGEDRKASSTPAATIRGSVKIHVEKNNVVGRKFNRRKGHQNYLTLVLQL